MSAIAWMAAKLEAGKPAPAPTKNAKKHASRREMAFAKIIGVIKRHGTCTAAQVAAKANLHVTTVRSCLFELHTKRALARSRTKSSERYVYSIAPKAPDEI